MQTPMRNAESARRAHATHGAGSVARAMGFVLSGSLCIACGSAPNAEFWSPPTGERVDIAGAAAVPDSVAGGGSGGNTLGASGGAPAVTVEPSLPAVAGAPAGGAPAGGAGGVAMRSLVDDMEANVSSIPELDGRSGFWYTFNDGQGGMQLPAPNGPFLPDPTSGGFPGSARARRTQGSAFSGYAGFGFDLKNPGGTRQAYDASAYGGVVLWARGSVNVRMLFPTRATAPTSEGGDCTANCNDSFGFDLSLSEQWSEHTVSFATLQQHGVPTAGAFDPKTLLGIAFSVPAGTDFDVWVDEIGFY